MSLSCSIDNLKYDSGLIICDSDEAGRAHRELFRFNDDAYVIADKSANTVDAISKIIDSFNLADKVCPSKIHITLNWENLLQITLWQATKPTTGDVFTLLRNAGITSEELQPFRTACINDIFPYLYYGKRLDILKKICHTAKRQIEQRFKTRSLRVDSHLFSDDTKRIVASSL